MTIASAALRRPRSARRTGRSSRSVPSLVEYIATVAEAAPEGARTVWSPYWDRMVDGFGKDGAHSYGDRRLDEITPTMLRAGSMAAARHAIRRRGSRDGTSASEHYIAAARFAFRCAVDDGLVESNPADAVPKPRRQPSRRQALTPAQLHAVWAAAAQGGHDPELDVLLLRFHLETGARREGALNLRVRDLRQDRQTVLLREKGGTEREQPVSGTLMSALLAHAERRHPQGRSDDQVLRYSSGAPLTRRRYNSLWDRVGRELEWVSELGVSMHWLRHTAITHVERVSSYAIAQRFAGHRPSEVTGTYAKASIQEVARAVQLITGEKHPLA